MTESLDTLADVAAHEKPLLYIPPEILGHITSYLAKDTQTLLSCLVVSREMHHFAVPLLYVEIEIRRPDQYDTLFTSTITELEQNRNNSFWSSSRRRFYLSSVQHITLRCPAPKDLTITDEFITLNPLSTLLTFQVFHSALEQDPYAHTTIPLIPLPFNASTLIVHGSGPGAAIGAGGGFTYKRGYQKLMGWTRLKKIAVKGGVFQTGIEFGVPPEALALEEVNYFDCPENAEGSSVHPADAETVVNGIYYPVIHQATGLLRSRTDVDVKIYLTGQARVAAFKTLLASYVPGIPYTEKLGVFERSELRDEELAQFNL